MPSSSLPEYPHRSYNMPEMRSVLGIIALTTTPTRIAGKGYTVTRQGTGSWDITLPRPIPTGGLMNVSFLTLGSTNEDITCKVEVVSTTVIRLKTFTGATPTDPNAATRGSFRIDHMMVKLPVV